MRTVVLGSAVVVRAPAKVNLFLEVLAKRPDGYHDIATLMLAVRLFDTLVFEPDEGLTLQCSRPDLSTGPDNLIMKAAQLLQAKTGCRLGARMRLIKRIPMAAGLAGGSTDAAAALTGLNQLWRLGCKVHDLAAWSGEIGSDIPFFFHTPAAWCTGRGEKVVDVPLGRPLDLVLVCPHIGLSTAEVYRNVVVPERPLTGEEICRSLTAGDAGAIGRLLHNRLQPPAEKLCPTVASWHEKLKKHGTAGQLMSGSGSSLFALCRDRDSAQGLFQELRGEAYKEKANVYLVRSCSSQL
jgi:4-diphosphocytidyl-2-C-methyl-D-erythritol kinase